MTNFVRRPAFMSGEEVYLSSLRIGNLTRRLTKERELRFDANDDGLRLGLPSFRLASSWEELERSLQQNLKEGREKSRERNWERSQEDLSRREGTP